MGRSLAARFVDAVTTHNVLVVVVMLALTAGVTAGAANLGSTTGDSAVDLPPTTPAEKADYVEANYATDSSTERALVPVYVRDDGGNALSKDALLESLRYQREVTADQAVAPSLADGGVRGVPNLVAARLADATGPSLADQIAAIEDASESEVETAVEGALAEDTDARRLLPREYEAGSASAESHRLLFAFTATEDGEAPDAATSVLYDAAADREDPALFTLGDHALAAYQEQSVANTTAFIVPIALALVVAVLAFTYRDLVDVVVGTVGVLASILWMFGVLGWLGVDVGTTMVIGPVLVAGLSIDYGFHVFTRYREHRGSGADVADAMSSAVRSVGFALAVVTLTTAIGFLSNVVNPVGSIRALGVGITLGVASAFVVFVTLVPALKVTLDGLLERVGLDRRKAPLGRSAVLEPLLRGSVSLAKRAAPVVLVVAVVAGTAGGVAWTTLDERPFDRQREPTADWKTDLPEPLGWEEAEYNQQDIYVQQHYRGVAEDASERVQLLVEGAVTADGTLDRVREGTTPLADGGRVLSPVTVMQQVAAEDESLAAALGAADTDDDGVPDEDLASVYDALYAAAPETASNVVERDAGDYESLRVVGPADGGGSLEDRAERQRAAADAVEPRDAALTATAVSATTTQQAGIEAVTAGILRVMALALLAVSLTFVAVARYAHGSATLGVVTVVPIVLVVGLVVAGMAVLDVPLTLVTALLVSLTVGLGVDYNIHLTDRFAEELGDGRSPAAALETAVVGTGGALVGSALTTAVAFAAILLHPSPQLRNFGTLVVLALLASLVASVVVLPSLLVLWSRHASPESVAASAPDAVPGDD